MAPRQAAAAEISTATIAASAGRAWLQAAHHRNARDTAEARAVGDGCSARHGVGVAESAGVERRRVIQLLHARRDHVDHRHLLLARLGVRQPLCRLLLQ